MPVTAREVIEEELRPLLRGVTHAYAFWVALAAALVLTALVPAGTMSERFRPMASAAA